MRKKFTAFLVVTALLLTYTPWNVLANDYESNEEWYINTCYDSKKAQENSSACKGYMQYLSQKAEENSNRITEIEGELASVKGDIQEQVLKVESYKTQIEALDSEIARIQKNIDIFEANIANLETEIAASEAKIEEIDGIVKDRMVAEQSTSSFNSYVDYIMSADNLVDLITRLSAANDIIAYEDNSMKALEEEIARLDELKVSYELQKEAVEAERETLNQSKVLVEKLKEESDRLIAEYLSKQADLEAQMNQYAANLDSYKDKLSSISDALNEMVPSYGWTNPIPSARITAEVWYYPASFGGGVHLGVDFAAPIGTSVRAVANGVVLYSANACGTYGYLGNTCGYPGTGGGGNQVYLLVRVDGKTYAVKYLHLKQDSPASVGTIVSAGDKIGEVGNSGNSSGAHTHVEIFYLGTMSIASYMNDWNGNLAFGAGMGSSALNRTCSATGGQAPCRIRPQDVLY